MFLKVSVMILMICIIFTACSKVKATEKSAVSSEDEISNPVGIERISEPEGRKILISDDENNASIVYDHDFYLEVDGQSCKIKDYSVDAPAIIADEFKYPRPWFQLYTIRTDNLYFVVVLNSPSTGISTSDAWFFVYKDNTLKLIRYLEGPGDDVEDIFPYMDYEMVEDYIILYIPTLDKHVRITPTNPDYAKANDNKCYFCSMIDTVVENNFIKIRGKIIAGGPQIVLSVSVYLIYSINENDIELIDITD